MNKQELVDAIAKKTGASKAETEKFVSAFTSEVVDAVALGLKVQLIGFGTFERAHREAREGRNPSTGETMKIPAKDIPKFTAGKTFKDAVEAAGKKKPKAKK